jgi:hypothetical protein
MKKLILLLIFLPFFGVSQSIYNDLSRMDKKELRIARNTVYAKHGRTFRSEDLVKYFNSRFWYKSNPEYSDKMLSQEDLDIIKIIQCWEKSNLVWSKKIDLNNDNIIDYIFLLKSHKIEYLIINNQLIAIDNPSDLEYEYASMNEVDIYNLEYNNINIIGLQMISNDDYNGSSYRLLFSYINNRITSTEIWLGNTFELFNDPWEEKSYFVNETGFCERIYKEYYEFDKGQLIIKNIVDYRIEGTEWEIEISSNRPCAACFIAGSKVLQHDGNYIFIEDLKIGDSVITYDLKSKSFSTSIVLGLASIEHNNLVELYFEHDTIISTTDHPFFVFEKGWSSFDSLLTMRNYINYDNVSEIQINDFFMSITRERYELKGYSFINKLSKMFTITELDNGTTFFLNKILVGTEEISPDFSQYFKN